MWDLWLRKYCEKKNPTKKAIRNTKGHQNLVWPSPCEPPQLDVTGPKTLCVEL